MPLLESLAGIAGLGPSGSYFEPPAWVDKEKNPGTTSMFLSKYGQPTWWRYYVTGTLIFYSPNLQWILIALTVWFFKPYDMQSARQGWAFMMYRVPLHIAVVLVYHGCWHVWLHWLGWSDRPIKPNRIYSYRKVAHNMWYSLLGVLMWCL